MAKDDLTAKVEALASTVVMGDPHDLQAVGRLIKLCEEIAESAEGELANLMKPIAKAAVKLAEEMIVQEGEEAAKSMRTLSQAVLAFQTALRGDPKAALEMMPQELRVD